MVRARAFCGGTRVSAAQDSSAYRIASIRARSAVEMFNKLNLMEDGRGVKESTEGFDVLIERSAMLAVVSSILDSDDELAPLLYKRANDCMVEAAHSPFFGGTKTSVRYEGVDVVRELVSERVRDELIRGGYPMPAANTF